MEWNNLNHQTTTAGRKLHNHATEQTKSCRDCNTQFATPNDTLAWFREKGLQPQACCLACRQRCKQTPQDGPVTATPLHIRQTATCFRSVTAEASYATIPKLNQALSSLETAITSSNLEHQEKSTKDNTVMRDNSPAEEESSSTSSKTMSYESHAEHKDHNHATEQRNSCRDCNIEFALPDNTLVWFLERGLQPPARCHACRHRRKQATEDRSVTEAALQTSPSMPGINSTNEDHFKRQGKFDKDNKVSRDSSL